VQTAPRLPWDRPEHCRHCRHDDWLETFCTGLIDRIARGQTQSALCVEPEINAMSIVGLVTAIESVFEVIQLDLSSPEPDW
jgi:hypothetical protein